MGAIERLQKMGMKADFIPEKKTLEKKLIATEEDYLPHINSLRDGSFVMGLTTGWNKLDTYLRHKPNTLNICGGMDNVGKSTILWYMAMVTSLYHDYKWLIYSSENTVGSVVRKLIEFYWNEEIAKMNEMKLKQALNHIETNFKFIKNDDVYSYSDLEQIAIETNELIKFNAMLIDPYNSLKGRGGNKHEDDYEILGEMLSFAKKYFTIWLNCHVFSSAAREVGSDRMALAPRKSQLEGGNKFANRCHDLMMVHRMPNHPTDYMWTEIHVQKVKEVETGGSYTPFDQPFKIRMTNFKTGFEDMEGNNPILNYHYNKPSNQTELKAIKENTEFDKPVLKNFYEVDRQDPPF